MVKKITYKEAGVNIEAGTQSVKRIKKYVYSTFNKAVLSDLKVFGALYDLKDIYNEYENPVLVQSIDSVGTKLMIANMMGVYTTIGIDMVAHSCNDILCQGAKPVTFLDYIAVDKLQPQQMEDILKGLCKGCKEVKMSLVGGEMAELPGIYSEGQFDLVGSITGVVEKEKIINGSRIRPGDVLLGLPSSGLHTNGFSLARKVLFDVKKYDVKKYIPELKKTLGEALLASHFNYTPVILPLLDKFDIKGISHITGGGLKDNIARILPKNCQVVIEKKSWEIPPLFNLIRSEGNVPEEDMQKTLNLGVGLVLTVSPDIIDSLARQIEKKGIKTYRLGEVVKGKPEVKFV